ncbi:unnamed protein product [Didymodactylos carnosus]|uniref:Uncharacterized protein n=1 Tax=Didymodactylos carnosus TaxID=1234261 RepID=A0A8S2EPB8_9BILA|nr:unnamed protein product [Didymodactylos carnosus]CAF4076523.1 unnamed protein product [Didymodactylos carnosus]
MSMVSCLALIAKGQRMLHKVHIDDEICASLQPIASKTVKNRSLNHSQYLQHRDRSHFFYYLRQKRKQRHFQHGRIPTHRQQEHVKEIKRSNQEQKREIFFPYINGSLKNGNKLISAIIGS